MVSLIQHRLVLHETAVFFHKTANLKRFLIQNTMLSGAKESPRIAALSSSLTHLVCYVGNSYEYQERVRQLHAVLNRFADGNIVVYVNSVLDLRNLLRFNSCTSQFASMYGTASKSRVYITVDNANAPPCDVVVNFEPPRRHLCCTPIEWYAERTNALSDRCGVIVNILRRYALRADIPHRTSADEICFSKCAAALDFMPLHWPEEEIAIKADRKKCVSYAC